MDIIFIQESKIFQDRSRRITGQHQSFESLFLIDNWVTERPRITPHVFEEVYNVTSRDILHLRLTSKYGQIHNLINIYNAPAGSLEEDALGKLCTYQSKELGGSFLLKDDFNLYYTR